MGTGNREQVIEQRGASAAKVSFAPLSLIAVTAFVPFMRVCNEVETPFHFVYHGNWASWLWLGPRFIGAALLALIIVVMMVQRATSPGQRLGGVALGVVASSFVSIFMEWFSAIEDVANQKCSVIMAGCLALLITFSIVSVVLFVRGWHSRGWQRWFHGMACYAALSVPLALRVLFCGWGDKDKPLIGAWLYSGALVALAGIAIWVLLPRRNPTAVRTGDGAVNSN